jgi:hypothetical protein
MTAYANSTPKQDVSPKTAKVFFDGNAELFPGTLLCYENDYVTTSTDPDETATGKFGGRSLHVALPSATNCDSVAGWTIGRHAASSNSIQVEIALAEPGNCCLARVEVASTINTSFFTPSISPGAYGVAYADGRIPGRGRVRALQTVNVKASRTDATSGPVYDATDATGSITTAGVLTDVGAFTYATEGDRIIILSGATAAGAAVTEDGAAMAGEYKIGTWTSANVVTVVQTDGTAFVGSATAIISYYVVRGYPTIPVRCDSDGRESGLCEFIQPLASTAVSPTALVGTTFLAGGTLTAANSTGALADGIQNGQRKIIYDVAVLGTNNYVLSPTNAISFTGLTETTVATATFDGVGDNIVFEWQSAAWRLEGFVLDAIA